MFCVAECFNRVITGTVGAIQVYTVGGVWAHLCTKCGWNTVNTHKIICNENFYCHAHGVNHTWQEAKNWYRDGLTIKP